MELPTVGVNLSHTTTGACQVPAARPPPRSAQVLCSVQSL